MAEEVVVDFKIDAEESLRVLTEINIQMAELQKEKEALDKAMKDGTATKEMVAQYTEIEAAMKTLQKARKAEEKEIYNEAQQYRYAADSVQGMSDRLRQMKDQYIKMSQAEREGEVGKKLAADIRNATNQITVMQNTIKPTIFDKLKNGIKSVGIAIKANPVGAILTAILFVIQKVTAAIRKNETAMAAIKKAMQSLQPVMKLVEGVLSAIANVIAKIIEKIGQLINKLIDSKFGKAIQKMLGISIDTSKAAEKTAESAEKTAKAVDNTADKIKEQQERAKEFAKNTKELAKLVEDLSADAIQDETQKALKQAEINYQRTIAEYKEKYKGQKQLNELLILLENEYQQKRADIIRKGEESKTKIIKESDKLLKEAQTIEDKIAYDENLRKFKDNEIEKSLFVQTELEKRFRAAEAEQERLDYLSTADIVKEFGSMEAYELARAKAHQTRMNAEWEYQDAIQKTNDLIVKQQQDVHNDTIKAQQEMIDGYMAIAASASSVVGSIHDVYNAIVGDSAEATKFSKALGMTQIIIDTAIATVAAIRGATVNGAFVPPQMVTIPTFIATLVGIVSSAITSSVALLKKAKAPSTPKFAEGGLVGNKTTNRTDDTIDAKLSEGEFVIRSKVVKALGVDFFNKINGGSGDNTNRFATGGLVPSISTISAVDNQINYEQMRNLMMDAVENIHPVVSVKEINSMQQKVQIKENISKY